MQYVSRSSLTVLQMGMPRWSCWARTILSLMVVGLAIGRGSLIEKCMLRLLMEPSARS